MRQSPYVTVNDRKRDFRFFILRMKEHNQKFHTRIYKSLEQKTFRKVLRETKFGCPSR